MGSQRQFSLKRNDSIASSVGSALVALVRESETPPQVLDLSEEGWQALLVAARFHRLQGLVLRRLENSQSTPAWFLDALRTEYMSSVASHLRISGDLLRLSEKLKAAGICWVVVKGPILADKAYQDPGARAYGDVDLLVQPADFEHVVEVVLSEGGMEVQRNWPLLGRLKLGQIVMRLPHGSTLDLHWNLMNTRQERRNFSFTTTDMLARREAMKLAQGEVWSLDPVDALLHLCTHGLRSGGHRLVWLKDIDLWVRRNDIDWQTLVSRGTSSKSLLVTGLMLERCRRVLGTPLPGLIAPGLCKSSTWATAILWAESRRGPAAWGRQESTGRTVLEATRQNTTSGIVALALEVATGIAIPRIRLKLRQLEDRLGLQPRSRPTLIDEAGNERDRESYLSSITSGDC